MKLFLSAFHMFLLFSVVLAAQDTFETDKFRLGDKDLEIYFIGHGTLMMKYGDLVIHVDPVPQEADYSGMPDADLILITHEHGDHLDQKAINDITKGGTEIILNQASYDKLKQGRVLKNGESVTIKGILVEAVPAYNTTAGREKFHPRGSGNGYVITLGGKKIYIAGDTENIPEMKNLKDIYIAFLPMNQPYTMTPEQAADAARVIKPEIFYPYHFGDSDTGKLVELMKGSGIEVRLRSME